MSKVTLPKLNQTGKNEWADVEDNDIALREGVNSVANEQLAGGIEDAKLASPNNAAYRTIFAASQDLPNGSASGTYMLLSSTAKKSGESLEFSDLSSPIFFYFDDADYAVSGKTLKMRLRAQIAVNAVKPTLKFTVGLYPVTVTGASTVLTPTLGTVVAGSTIEFNEPAASTITSKEAADFTVPADGAYMLGVVTSASITLNNISYVNAQLQVRNA